MAATNREDYTARQAQQDRDYEASYAKWFASLPPAERRKLKAQGLDKPDLDRVAKKANRSGDVSEFNLEDHSGESTEMPDTDHFPDAAQIVSAAAVIRPLLGIILGNDNPVLTVKCIALAVGMDGLVSAETAFVTEASVAREHHLTRAALSKRIVALTRSLCLKPSAVMRPEALARTYAITRVRSHFSQCQRSTPSTRQASPSKKPSRSKS